MMPACLLPVALLSQAVMKAGGQSALRVATLAVIHARRRLKKSLGGDCMVVPQWITEVGARPGIVLTIRLLGQPYCRCILLQ